MKLGDLAVVKITGEIVQIIANSHLEDGRVPAFLVRRANIKPDGIKYEVETFFIDELETQVDNLQREADIMIQKLQLNQVVNKKAKELNALTEQQTYPDLKVN